MPRKRPWINSKDEPEYDKGVNTGIAQSIAGIHAAQRLESNFELIRLAMNKCVDAYNSVPPSKRIPVSQPIALIKSDPSLANMIKNINEFGGQIPDIVKDMEPGFQTQYLTALEEVGELLDDCKTHATNLSKYIDNAHANVNKLVQLYKGPKLRSGR